MVATGFPNHHHGRGACATGLLCSLLLCVASTAAQPVPSLKSITPEVVRRGETTAVTLAGDQLANASQVLVTGQGGVTAELRRASTRPADGLTVSLAVSPDAPRGPRELRVLTPHGVTRPALLWIDDLPGAPEREPNNSPGQAEPVTLPAVITGRIAADLDVDCFAFDGRKGQRLIFDVHASREGSKLDASLTLLDPTGRRVAHDEDTNALDPLIDYTVPADGRYTLRVQDLQYKGGPDYAYRIRAGEIPYVDAAFPLGLPRGQQVPVELKGRNIPAPATHATVRVDSTSSAATFDLDTPAGPVALVVSDLPEFTEPPGAAAGPVPLPSLPIVVNGRIARPGEADTYRFKAPAAGPIVLEVAAARLGSRLDALLTLTDDKGAVLQRNDDAAGADARVQFTAEKDKTYQVTVRDLTDAGGDDYAYRLSIAPPRPARPDFDVVLRTPEPFRLNRGGRTALWASVARRGNFPGDVTVSFWPLPPGVTCRPLRVSATQPTSGVFTLTAADDAPLGVHPLSVIATGYVGDEVVTRGLSADPRLKVVRPAHLTVHEPAPFNIERVGPPPVESDPKIRAEKVAALEKVLNTPTPQLDAAQARWEKTFDPARAWEIVEVIDARASSSIPLVKQPDGSVLATGRVPSADKYTVLGRVAAGGIRSIRLEAIATGGVGPGRAENGNFVLSTFRVAALPPGSTDAAAGAPLELASATATFNQPSFDVADTIPGKPDAGWAISPETGKTQSATYRLKSPFAGKPGGPTTLAFTLDHASKYAQHVIGRFRLLVTSAEKPDDATAIPSALLAVLKTPAEQRTKEQGDSLAAFYHSIAPELAPSRTQLAALKSSGAAFPPVVTVGGVVKLDVVITRPPDMTADITLTLEGFSAGLDTNAKDPAPFAKNFDFAPVTLRPTQSATTLEFRPKPTSEKGTRDAILRAEATINGAKYTLYSHPFPVTVK